MRQDLFYHAGRSPEIDCLSARSWGQTVPSWQGEWTPESFWLMLTVLWFIYMSPFPGNCHGNFCSDSSGSDSVPSGNLQVLHCPVHNSCLWENRAPPLPATDQAQHLLPLIHSEAISAVSTLGNRRWDSEQKAEQCSSRSLLKG